MDDRSDNPQEEGGEPGGVRSGPAVLRAELSQVAPRLAVDGAAGPAHEALSVRHEPVLSPPAQAAPVQNPGMFDASPREILPPPALSSAIPAAFPPRTPGFFPPGAGLIPAALLPQTSERQGGVREDPVFAPRPAASVVRPPIPAVAPRFEPRAAPRAPAPAFDAPRAAAPPPPSTSVRAAASDAVRDWRWYARKILKYLAVLGVIWLVTVSALILAYRFVDPPLSALMLQRWLSGEQVTKTWMPIEGMSPSLVRAVLTSEDGRFCQHGGIDLEAVQSAIERAGGGTPRGASTISMQVAKNLFLWPSKSYLRKALEVPLTLAIETVWPKKRIMEIYLNIAEWGPGVYGAEAAARYHFAKSARQLGERESALLAVTLPNPIRRNAGKPGFGTRRLASLIQARSAAVSRAQMACVLPGPRRN